MKILIKKRLQMNLFNKFRKFVEFLYSEILSFQPKFRFLRRKLVLSDISKEGFTFKLASSADELDQAYRLLHDAYVKEGYMQPHPSGLRCSIFGALPYTSVLIAKYKDEVVSTVSL